MKNQPASIQQICSHYVNASTKTNSFSQEISNKNMYMLWFNFIPGLNFVFLCFKLIIIHYHAQTQRKINLNQG